MKKYHKAFLVAIIMLLPAILLLMDIYKPEYSRMGDEYSFFRLAKFVSEKGLFKFSPFSMQGVYGIHPVADSIFQAIFMKIFGVNLFSWKLLNILIVSTSTFLVFKIAELLTKDSLVGIASATFFAFSHYILAFAHVGYNNLHAFIPFLLAFLFLARFLTKKKLLDSLFVGIFSGLSLFTFFSARLILLIMIFYIIKKLRAAKIAFLGFLPFFIMLIYSNGLEVFSTMSNKTIFGFNKQANIKAIIDFGESLFFDLKHVHHNVSGPLITIVFTVFIFIGVIYLAKNLRKEKEKLSLILVWSWILAVIILLSSEKTALPITRLHIIIPLFALTAGFGLVKSLKKSYLIFPILLIYVLMELNLFYIKTPKVQARSEFAIILEIAQTNPQKSLCVLHDGFDLREMIALYKLTNVKLFSSINDIEPNQQCDILTLPVFEAKDGIENQFPSKYYDEAGINYVYVNYNN